MLFPMDTFQKMSRKQRLFRKLLKEQKPNRTNTERSICVLLFRDSADRIELPIYCICVVNIHKLDSEDHSSLFGLHQNVTL